jgi:nucleoside-diphosphate-sugar epimerase
VKKRFPHKKTNKDNAVLVTGGAGFVGTNLCKALLRKGFVVYAVDNLITGKRENITPLLKHDNFFFLKLDVVTPRFSDTFSRIPVGQVFHLACPTGVPNIKKLGEEMLMTCSAGTLNVLELARIHKAKILYTSSAEVYGQPEVTPQHEDYCGHVHPLGPRSAYEEGKRFSETLALLYVEKYEVPAKIVRIFNTYGPGMSLSDTRVIPQFLNSVITGEDFCVYGDGLQTRTHLYVDDLLEGLFLIMEKGLPGEAYNVGGQKQTTIKELAETVIKLTGNKNKIIFKPHFIEDHKHREPSTKKVQSLGWRQSVPIEEGLKRMMLENNISVFPSSQGEDSKVYQGAGLVRGAEA